MRQASAVAIAELPVEIVSPPQDINCTENTSATFSVRLNKKNVPVKWLRDGKEITDAFAYEHTDVDYEHTLTLIKAKLDDAAQYTVVVADKSAAAKLLVDGES
jgi:hypothetical protein